MSTATYQKRRALLTAVRRLSGMVAEARMKLKLTNCLPLQRRQDRIAAIEDEQSAIMQAIDVMDSLVHPV